LYLTFLPFPSIYIFYYSIFHILTKSQNTTLKTPTSTCSLRPALSPADSQPSGNRNERWDRLSVHSQCLGFGLGREGDRIHSSGYLLPARGPIHPSAVSGLVTQGMAS
jgi:hypothetical protein